MLSIPLTSEVLNARELWALRDVAFDVEQGTVLGIIGSNGAGKSTLLKMLSRVTTPTAGRARVIGRVGTILEVGTGFHPELTGRENIYLSGAILGMRKAEVERRFDEIIAFAGVERFVDTPVKRYSSGMYVRLAFAVAAHLEPDIRIIDEVLAVGDIGFQQTVGPPSLLERPPDFLQNSGQFKRRRWRRASCDRALDGGRCRLVGTVTGMSCWILRSRFTSNATAGRQRPTGGTHQGKRSGSTVGYLASQKGW